MERPVVHLSPGQLVVTREACVVSTVLGSCVAVTMFHADSALTAICHAMLDQPRAREEVRSGDPARFRFMSHAVPEMIAAYRRAGVRPRAVEVKLFGGANVIGGPPGGDRLEIGSANVAAARRLLATAGFVVAAENTGGDQGRKILFDTVTGEVLHKHLARRGA